MHSINTNFCTIRCLLLGAVLAVMGSMSYAQTCTYELTVVRSPEALGAKEFREQLTRLGVKFTEEEFMLALKTRNSGFTGKKKVQFKRVGARLEGPLHGVNGMTHELVTDRFMVDENAFITCNLVQGGKGLVFVRKPEHYRMNLCIYEEQLLVGEGTLKDRYAALRSGLGVKDKNNPNNESLKKTKDGLDMFFGRNLCYRASFNDQKSTLTITKMVPPNFETMTYREIPNEDFEDFEEYVPIGSRVSDYRLSDAFATQYDWDSELPTLNELANMDKDRGNRSAIPVALYASLGVVACGSVVMFTTLIKRRRKKSKE